MRLHELKPSAGSRHRKKRLGCGESSGHGKTSGKGHKGQKSRAGFSLRPGFEGGQMPLHRQLPKKGFNNARFRKHYAIINVGTLEERFESDAVISEPVLREAGLVKGRWDGVKILGNGELTKSLIIEDIKCSASARTKIESAGGSLSTASA